MEYTYKTASKRYYAFRAYYSAVCFKKVNKLLKLIR